MKLLVIFFLVVFINARENPFFPSKGEKDIPITSNKEVKLQKFKKATISLPTDTRVLQKITLEYKNLDGSLGTKTLKLNKSIDWHLPIFISQEHQLNKQIKKNFQYITSIKYAKFYTSNKQLKIITKDKIIRDFLLVQPHRIVIDFKRDSHLKGLVKKNNNNIFTKIRVGNHNGYYRVVLELDGYYRYKKKSTPNGYIFSLR